ncbi:MAG: amino acid permease [Aquisalinus sp.]|nr:amino acid permease [Aquisalinus sp.]
MTSQSKMLGPLLATFIVAGNMIGSGVFLLPAGLAQTGSSSLIGWLVAALGAAMLAGVYAILGTIRPQEEGLIEYPARALHPGVGFLSWLGYWIGNWIGNIAVILAAVGYIASLVPGGLSRLSETLVLIALIWAIALANLAGARQVGRFAGVTLVVGLFPIVAVTLLGLFNFDPDIFAASWNVSGEPLTGSIPPTVLTIFWAFLGLESANAVAPVIRDPKRNVAIAAIGGVSLAAILYAAASAALFGILPASEMAASSAPFADAAAKVAGAGFGTLIALAAIARTLGCAGGWFMVTAQTGRTGAKLGFLPASLKEEESPERPVRNVLLVAVLMTLIVFATLSPTLNDQFLLIVDFTVLVFLGIYTLSALALIRFAGGLKNDRQKLVVRLLALASTIYCVYVAAGSY